MTFSTSPTPATPPVPARHILRSLPAVPAVVALLLSAFAGPALAQMATGSVLLPPIATSASSVDSIVSKTNGPILDVFGGALQLDVTNATITGGDDRLMSPLPWAGILVGSRVLAQISVPDTIPAVFPPRLVATRVVVFLQNAGSLSGTVQGVSLAAGSFLVDFVSVKTTAATDFSGQKADGTPVKGLSDLSGGMFATASVLTDGSGVTAQRVFAYAIPTTRLVAFRGKVEKIDTSLWTIDGRVVQVTAETKITGDPRVGDLVDVVEKVQILPPGSLAPTTIPVAVSITKVDNPPPPPNRTVEFDGVVESLPPTMTATYPPMGVWTISGKSVLVTGLTKVDAGIAKGSAVHVKGYTVPSPVAAGSAAPQVIATEITKKS